ncbi:type II toxin-antitoxin system RelE/ParE family toxin (plasmid) [Paracoccus yeei]|uniref:Type II toxin-antitoxin system RelE/ParE family toxin n=2 Tax=Paracoccus TaxID=265 RepID=A0A1V0GYQ9_9RHOB|nr:MULTISPECIES: type II toxin-antitoxin system RelE/ParE family toxin [Paracoccus]ARC38819.1 type II toxin-antitoxin system RelE/ParE family toxin [Paracoccus yeei]MTE02070.1 type II toxin-antitoxin system RelE/ParE family toxin [Paracoccus lichenicola]
MPQLIWTPEALQGVQRCYRFLAPKNLEAAARAVRAIREGMQIVSAHPGVGRPADKMEPAFREWLIPFGDSGYVVLYRVDDDLAVVLAVRHQREAGYY